MPAKPVDFEDNYMPEPNSGCWLWLGSLTAAGYGQVTTNGRRLYAHRFSYERSREPIPEGLDVDHKCRCRCCVNPDHLEPVTRRENLLRGETIPANNLTKTHCRHGHPLTGANVRITPKGERKCRACHRQAERRRYHEGRK